MDESGNTFVHFSKRMTGNLLAFSSVNFDLVS
jgi:hypothetical protein